MSLYTDGTPGQARTQGGEEGSWAALTPSLKPYNPGMIAARSWALWGDRSQCWAAGARTAAWDSCSGRAGLGGREEGTGPSPVPTGPLGGGGGRQATEQREGELRGRLHPFFLLQG